MRRTSDYGTSADSFPDGGFTWFSSVVRQMPGYTVKNCDNAPTSVLHVSRVILVCDWSSLSSEPRQPTNQNLSLPLLPNANYALDFGVIIQGHQTHFKFVSISISPCWNLGVCCRAQRYVKTQEWLRVRPTSTCFCASLRTFVSTLASFGLTWLFLTTSSIQLLTIRKE